MNEWFQSLNCHLWKGVSFFHLILNFLYFFSYLPCRTDRVFSALPLKVHSFFLLFFSALIHVPRSMGRTFHTDRLFFPPDSPSLDVHHSLRWLRQHRGSAFRPVGFQGPAETRAGLFVRKWFSLCWGGHSKSSLAISVMALRCCCLCPVMVTDDRLGRRGPARRPAKGWTTHHVHTHKHLHKTALHWWPLWLQVIVSSQDVVLVVILNDHSKRGVLTICPFTGKMILLYRFTPLLPP